MKLTNLFIVLFIFSSFAVYSQWQQTAGTPQGAGVTDMVVLDDGTLIVTTASYNWPGGEPGGIRRSTDGGNSWQNINNVYNARTLWLGSTGKIFASYWPYPSFESAYYSTNNGVSWNLLLTLSSNNNIFSIASKNNDSTVFLGTRDGIRRTTNNGTSFINLTNGLPANSWVRDLAISPQGYIAAATTNGLFISTNNGNNWVMASGLLPGDTVVSVIFDTLSTLDGGITRLYAGTNNGELYQAFEGNNFLILISLAVFAPGEMLFGIANAGTILASMFPKTNTGGGVYHSSNGGQNWEQKNDGLPSNAKTSAIYGRRLNNNLQVFQTYAALFENAVNGGRMFKRQVPIGIQSISSEVPSAYSLSQNYPNPFNPATYIEFSITKASFVKLVVYDMLGSETEILVSQSLNAGKYRADWNASKYSSGVYFYKLFTDNFSETKKMILNK